MSYRYEIKYVLQHFELPLFEHWIHRCGLFHRAYDDRKVNSIYLDTLDLEAAHDNLIGIGRRVKHRIRWYEQYGQISEPKYELKLKNSGLCTKLRSEFGDDLDAVDRLLDASHTERVNILNMVPVLQENGLGNLVNILTLKVEYVRTYYQSANSLRLTVDRQMTFGDLLFRNQLMKLPVERSEKLIIEFKFSPGDEHNVSEIMSTLPFHPTRNSKYVLGLSMFGHCLYF